MAVVARRFRDLLAPLDLPGPPVLLALLVLSDPLGLLAR
jgi:hypothetical protein